MGEGNTRREFPKQLRKEGGQPKQFGFMCKDCFRKFCKDSGLDISGLAGLGESITIGPGDENG